jgi:hypothetical protein
MTTWQQFDTRAGSGISGAATTTWAYDAYRGWLVSKRYPDGLGPDYSYTPGGRLYTRTWARTLNNGPRITTTYSYNPAGDLARVDYSDDTAHVSFTYDRLGRRLTAESADMTITFGYNDANQLTSESYSGGPLDGLSVTNGYDPALRRTSLVLLAGPQPQILHSVAYAHDPAGRLQTVTSGSASATYFYLAHSPLVGQITFSHNGQTVMTTTKQYDRLNRLTQIVRLEGQVPPWPHSPTPTTLPISGRGWVWPTAAIGFTNTMRWARSSAARNIGPTARLGVGVSPAPHP